MQVLSEHDPDAKTLDCKNILMSQQIFSSHQEQYSSEIKYALIRER